MQHQLDRIIALLPDLNPMKPKFSEFQGLSGFATTFRYPTPKGKINKGMSDVEFLKFSDQVKDVIETLVKWHVIDIDIQSEKQAGNSQPVRAPKIGSRPGENG